MEKLQAKQRVSKRRNKKQSNRPKTRKRNIVKQLAELNVGRDFNPGDQSLIPTDFRRYKQPANLMSALQIYHKHVRDQYLMGLVHPDLAVRNGVPVKLPSDLPIPSASIGYHVQHQFTTSSNGTFLLTWRPPIFVTQDALNTSLGGINAISNLTYNNSPSLTGTTVVSGNNFVDSGVYPNVSVQRYRLVSAVIKASYNGSVISQAGTMIACATFDTLSVCSGTTGTPVTGVTDIYADRFGQFNTIQNGLWNRTVNITRDSEGIECLYVPTDPDDYIFNRMGYYFDMNLMGSPGAKLGPNEGAHINYIIAGRNMPINLSCVVVDIYYNWEVIADPTSAYVLRANADMVYSVSDKAAIAEQFSTVAKTGGLIKTIKSHDWSNTIATIAKTGLSYLLGALA